MNRSLSKAALLAAGLALPGLLSTACGGNKTPKTPTIAFSFPTTGETLHQSDNTDPSAPAGTIQVTVTLSTTNISASSAVTLTVDGTPAATTATVSAAGNASLPNVSLSGSASGTSHSLRASVTDSGGNGSASATVTVSVVLPTSATDGGMPDGGACSVTVSPPTGTLFNETGATVAGQATVKDESPAEPGMQAKITAATNCPAGTVAALTAGAAQLATGTVAGGQVVFDEVTLPDTPVTALTTPALRLQVTVSVGTDGSSGSDTVGYIVDSSTPTCTITAPSAGAMFKTADIAVSGSTQGFVPQIAAGLPATVTIVNAAGLAYANPAAPDGGTLLQADGAFSTTISLLNGTDVLICEAATATGNLAQSAPVSVTANLPLAISITQPTAGQVLNVLDDENQAEAGLQTQISLAATAAPGSPIAVCSTVAPAPGATSCPFGGSAFLVASATSAGATLVLSGETLGEGDQTLTAQISQGGQSVAATPVPISVHTLRPVVTALAFSPDYVDGDGGLWLNSTNLSDAGAATVATVVLAAGDTFVSDAGAVKVSLVVPGTGEDLGSGPVVVNGSQVQAQVPLHLPDGVYAIQANVTDIWGNPNYGAALVPPLSSVDGGAQADATLAVKTSLPSCSFTGPTGPYWNVQDNGGVADGGVSLPVTLSTSNGFATVAGVTIPGTLSIGLSGATPTVVAVAGSQISTNVVAPQGPDSIVASLTDPAGNPAQSCSPSLSITVATVPPTLAIGPTSSWTPPPDVPGNNPPEYTSTRNFQVPVTTDAPNGTVVTSTLNGLSDGTGVVAAGSATLSEHGLDGTDTFTISVQDAAGNATSQQATVQVNAPGCGLFFSQPAGNPAYFDAASGTVSNGTLQASIVMQSDCDGTQVTLTKTPNGGSPAVTTQPTNGSGLVTFPESFGDGETGTLSATITKLLVTNSVGPIPYYTKLTPPVLTAPAPAASPVWIVANSGNPNAGSTLAGTLYIASSSAYSAGGNPFATAIFSVKAANLGPTGGDSSLGTAALHLGFAGSTDPAAQTLMTDPQTVTFGPLELPPEAAGSPVTLTITDTAGNATVQSWMVQTAAIPPGAPAVTPTVTDERRATVQLAWNAPADGSGSAVAGYDLRWALPAQGWGTSITDAQFFAVTGVTQDPGIGSLAGAAPGTQQSYNLTALPPFNSWSIALRSVDAAGNRSEPIAVESVNDNTIAGNPAQNWNQVSISEGATDYYFGYEMLAADFNGDGLDDLAISNPQFDSTPGTVWILNGNANPAQMTLANAQALTLGVANDDFGANMAAGAFTAGTFPALAVGSLGWVGCQGRVDIYLGGASGLSAAPAIELQGSVSTPGCFGATVRSIGDVDGDGFPDLFVGAPFNGARFTPAQGNGYIFFSSSLKKDVVGGTTTIVPLASADLVFDGSTAEQQNLGYRSAAFALGIGFFLLPASGANVEYAFAPSAVLPSAASANAGAAAPISTNSAAFSLTDGTGTAHQSKYAGFGTAGIGGVSFTGGTTPDVVITSSLEANTYLYTTTANGVNATPVVTLSEPSCDFGWTVAAADVNGDGSQDLIVGSNDLNCGAYLYLNQQSSPCFLSTPSAVINHGSDTYFGFGLAAGHFHDASVTDLAIADGTSIAIIYY